jgi:hypothetical protein
MLVAPWIKSILDNKSIKLDKLRDSDPTEVNQIAFAASEKIRGVKVYRF